VPWLARWSAVDPLESKYTPWSSYNYGFDNPVKWQDSTGMGPDDPQMKESLKNKQSPKKDKNESINWDVVNQYITPEKNLNNPAKKIELSIFIDETVSQVDKKKINLETVKGHIERIYKENGIAINVNIIMDQKKGDVLYGKFRKEQLPLNEFVLKITDDPVMTKGRLAGVFIPTSDNYKLVVNYGHIKSQNISFNTGREMNADINYQIGNTAAHEMLHGIINSIVKFYGIPESDFYSTFHLVSQGGEKAHTIEFGNLLDRSGLPPAPSKEDDGILSEQVVATNLFLMDIANPGRSKQSSINVMNQFSKSSYEQRRK
jgi:hypothetical protein